MRAPCYRFGQMTRQAPPEVTNALHAGCTCEECRVNHTGVLCVEIVTAPSRAVMRAVRARAGRRGCWAAIAPTSGGSGRVGARTIADRSQGQHVRASRRDRHAVRWRLIGTALAASAAVQSSPLASFLVAPAAERLRARMPCMSAPMVLRILDLLTAAELQGWVAGGWGIDALAGRETRRHYDLDLVIDHARGDYPRVAEALSRADFGLRAEYLYPKVPMPLRYEWIHADGRSVVDILPVDFQCAPFNGPPERLTGDSPHRMMATGSIDGRPVPCLGAKLQAALHSGYPPRIKDYKDRELLHGLLVPG
jgi:lincosamide nucleotidyltransferase A/C/D/E